MSEAQVPAEQQHAENRDQNNAELVGWCPAGCVSQS